jgi:hypothetical protein
MTRLPGDLPAWRTPWGDAIHDRVLTMRSWEVEHIGRCAYFLTASTNLADLKINEIGEMSCSCNEGQVQITAS